MSEKEVALKIIGAMLEQDIVPVVFDIEPAKDGGWKIDGLLMGLIPVMRHPFHGTASPDGSSFTVTSGAFGKLTEDGLDVFHDLTPPQKPEDSDDPRGWPEEALQ